MGIDRIVHFRPRTIFASLGILLAVGVVLYVLWAARHVLSWVLIALFLSLALNPAVELLQRRGLRRGLAVSITFLVAIAVVAGLGALFIPTGAALAVTKSVVSAVVAVVAIVFITLFMVLEGPEWMERIYGLVAEERRPRPERIGHEIYRTVGGYVSGNLLISLIAGISSGS